MLFRQATLAGIADGSIDRVYRRWDRPRIKVGTKQRTATGLIEITEVAVVSARSLTTSEARRAGCETRGELLKALGNSQPGQSIYRIGVRPGGVDPRIALRNKARLSAQDVAELQQRLRRLDKASRQGPWTEDVLQIIAERPAVRAPELAASFDMETQPFKRNVRKLKELGLTESLAVGYKLSPRGRALVKRLGCGAG